MAQKEAWARTMAGQYPFGLWFDDQTGEFIDLFEVHQEIVEKRLKYFRYVGSERRDVVRVEPWEI